MSIQGPETAAWFDRAFGALVNGVSSGWRYWGRDDTIVIARGEGGHVYDSDGKRRDEPRPGPESRSEPGFRDESNRHKTSAC